MKEAHMPHNRHTQTQPTQEELPPLASTSQGHVVPRLQPGKHVGQRCCPAVQRSKEDMSRLDMVPKHRQDRQDSGRKP